MSQPKRLTLTARCEIAAADASQPKAPRTFRMVANTGEPMRIYPWDSPVVVDLATVDTSGLPVPALYDHTPSAHAIVGVVEAVAMEGGALVAAGKFTPTGREDDAANVVLAKADAGYVWQTSVGGDPTSVEEIKAGQTVVVNGRTYAGPVCVARGLVLREISFVVLGGDRRTSAVVANHNPRRTRRIKASGGGMTFSDFVQSMGFSEDKLDETQAANLRNIFAEKYPAEDEVKSEEGAKEEEKVAAEGEEEMKEEEEEMPTNAAAKAVGVKGKAKPAGINAAAEIARLCEEHGNPKIKVAGGGKVSLVSHALTSGWSVSMVKDELLKRVRAERPKGPTVITKGEPSRNDTLSAMQGALLLRSGVALDHPAFNKVQAVALNIPAFLRAGLNDATRNRLMEAAHRYSGYSAFDLAREACRIEGKAIHGVSRSDVIQAAFSSASFTNAFTTNVNAVLLTSYLDTPDTTMGWVQEQDVADFRTQERPRATKGSGLAKLPPGGTADDYTLSDVGESYKIARYARKFQVDEQNIIDDNLGVLQQIPTEMGQAAARLRPDLVYAILLDNPTLTATAVALFSASNPSANLLTSAALTSTTLKAAIAAMLKFQENSVNLNLMPTHILVPPSLRHATAELINSSTIYKSNGASSTVEFGSENSLRAEGLQLVCDARLENGVTDPADSTAVSGSATSWYLACNYAHTVEVGYLRGTGRAPQVRSFQLDRGQWGMGWDIKMDIGAKALDWKGMIKNTA